MITSKGMLSKVAGLACMAALAAGLTGCQGNKKQSDLALQEASELRERNATLEQAAREKDTRIAELETRLANSVPAGTPAVTPAAPTNWQAPAPVGFNTGGNFQNDEDFQRDSSGNMVATIAGNVLFDSGQATIKSDARRQLDRIAQKLNSTYRGAQIRIEGHTDSDPIRRSKWGSNEALSKARADAVRDYLASKGVRTGRIDTDGLGSSRPKATKAASRRVEIIVMTNN